MLDGDEKPPTLTGVGAAPRQPSAQGGSLQGIDVPMHGLPRGRVAAIAAGTGALCLALGAALAYRAPTVPETIPVTPVGLIGEPAAVVPVRTVEPGGAAAQRPSTGGRNTSARNTTAARTNGSANTGSAAGSDTGRPTGSANAGSTNAGSTAGNANAGSTNTGSTAGNANTGGTAGNANAGSTNTGSTAGNANTGGTNAGGTNAGGTLPPAENGVIERGPRVTTGGFHLGDETDATGTMDPRVFSYVYNHYKTQISACYSSASRARSLSGVIVLRVRIGTSGRVSSTRVISDSVRNADLTQCVQNAVRAWAYPEPAGGEVEVDYPMRFGSSS